MDDNEELYILMQGIGNGASCRTIELAIGNFVHHIGRARMAVILNQTDPRSGVTPLMVLTIREDNEETIRVAELLLRSGARIDTRDTSGPGCTALLMACQEGKPNLLKFFIEQGAEIDTRSQTSPTKAVFLAAQNGHAQCVAHMAEAAAEQGKDILESRSRYGRTLAYTGVERGFPDVVGVLAKAGADLRKACPVYFSFQNDALVDPTPSCPIPFALCSTVRSFVSESCVTCGATDNSDALMKCARCRMAFYCSADCQRENWSLHKKVCRKLREGQNLVGDPDAAPPSPPMEPFGFEENFTAADDDSGEDYDRENHPVWEYDAGRRGQADWRRYPPVIEEGLESLAELGSPRYMFRPGNPAVSGASEEPLSPPPPPNVSTRYVYYCDMVERDIYTGAARSVRRNGRKEAPRTAGSFF